MRAIKFKFVGFVIGALALYLMFFYSYFGNYIKLSKVSRVKLEHVVVHLDLKGSPPKLEYLTSLLPQFRKLGVNGLLMEYEDSFPYQDALVNLSSKIPYSATKLQRFLTLASELQIEIIPLVQTFGHMEHALKLKEFQHLREIRTFPDSICPSKQESINLIKEMLKQVIQFHNRVTPLKHIHIGCDEVYRLKKCEECLRRKLSARYLFVDHVTAVKTLVHSFDPLIRILIWDDMFRYHKTWNIQKMSKMQEMEPVYWDYSPNLGRVSHINLYHYHQTFNNIWYATAFKGADGKRASLPNLTNRFENHYSWLYFTLLYMFGGENEVFDFKGVILTGWSRYGHLEPLCELLPASISSLVMNLFTIEKFRDGVTVADTLLTPDLFFDKYIANKLSQELKCKDKEMNFKNISLSLDTCKYKSGTLVTLIKRYDLLMSDIKATFEKDLGIVSLVDYYSNIQNLNVLWAIKSLNWCRSILRDLKRWEKKMSLILMKYYDKFVIEEYVGYKTYSIKKKIRTTLKQLENYVKVNIWERRSYKFDFMKNKH